MPKPLKLGNTVRAKCRISEELFGAVFVHAERGELGTVLDIAPGALPTIRFHESGTTYDCSPDEIERAEGVSDPITERFNYITCRRCHGSGAVLAAGRWETQTCPTCKGFQQELVRV